MNCVPPISVRQVGDRHWFRFLVMDGLGQYWTGQGWSDQQDDALLYLRESEAMRAGLRLVEAGHGPKTLTTEVRVSVSRGEWTTEELIGYLKRWGRFLLLKSEESREVKVEIAWDGLEVEEQVAE